jgi:mono/diheme cytochrome c family protein
MKLNSVIAGLTLSLAIVVIAHALGAEASAQAAQQNRAAATDPATPTFTRDVAAIMFAKCASCHRPGEVAPMPLLSYSDARPWASAIKQKVSTRAMPPWHADPAHGTFRNDLRLSDKDIDTIVRWVDGGAREGDPSALPPLPKFPEGWQIGKPDAVFEMAQDFDVPASGEIAYQYFEVPTNFTEDKWMQAGEVRAGDRSHVHHIIVYVREPGRTARPNVITVRPIIEPAAPLQSEVLPECGGNGTTRSGSAGRPTARWRRCDARQLGRRRGRAGSPAWHRETDPRRLDADLPGALHDQRQAGTRPLEDRTGLRERGAAARDPHRPHFERRLRDPARRRQSSGRSRSDVQR